MITLRRFLCIFALMFWQGGFTFWAAVIVPVSGVVLEPDLHLRARITDTVTNALNLAGVVTILLLMWDFASSADPSRRRSRTRVILLAILLVTLAALFPLHYWLELLDPPQGTGPADSATFLVAHLIYVSVSTVQLLAALVYLGVTLRAWRAEDGRIVAPADSQHGGTGIFVQTSLPRKNF